MARDTLWLCLHLPRLGLEHWLKSDPEGGGARPRALAEAGRLTQLNLPARAQGLKPAMALSTALSICQTLETRPRDIPAEQRTLRLLADWAYGLSPEVSISKDSNILIQIADSINLFNGAERIQEAAVAGLQGQGYSVSASLGPTPLSAQALAEAGQGLSLERLQSALPG
jgi:impB/mucB/samB family.